MKLKNVILGVALIVASMSFGQEKGDFSGFAGLAYPLESGAKPGVNAGVEYMISDKFAIAPSFTYYFYSGVTSTAINVDARYYLGSSDTMKYFGVAGYTRASVSGGGVSAGSNGYNVGAGLIYALSDNMGILAQAKYTGNSGGGSFEPMVGLNFSF